MTKLKGAEAHQEIGNVTPVPLTRKQLLEGVASAYKAQGRVVFQTLFQVEAMDLEHLRSLPTAGNIFEVADQALGNMGVTTDGTMGSLMDALSLDQDEVHIIACYCHEKSGVMGADTAGYRFSVISTVA